MGHRIGDRAYEAALSHFREALEVRADRRPAGNSKCAPRSKLHAASAAPELEEGRDRLARKSRNGAEADGSAEPSRPRDGESDNTEGERYQRRRAVCCRALVLAGQRAWPEAAGGNTAPKPSGAIRTPERL